MVFDTYFSNLLITNLEKWCDEDNDNIEHITKKRRTELSGSGIRRKTNKTKKTKKTKKTRRRIKGKKTKKNRRPIKGIRLTKRRG